MLRSGKRLFPGVVAIALGLTATIGTPAGLGGGNGATGVQRVAIRYAWPPLDAATFDGRSPDTKDAAYAAHQ